MFRKIAKISLLLFTFLLLVLSLSYILLRSRPVQNWLAGKITTYLSDELHTRVVVGGVDIEFFRSVVLEDLYVEDLHHDTLLFARELTLDLRKFDDVNRQIYISSATLTNADINFLYYPNDSDYNFGFLVAYFDPPRKTPRIGPKKIWIINIEKLKLENTSYSISDLRAAPRVVGEFDHNHLQFDSIEADIRDFRIIDDSLVAEIKDMRCVEQSGIRLTGMQAGFTISSTMLELKNLRLLTPYSHIQHYFKLAYASYDDLSDFENNVNIFAEISDSKVSFKDLAYFDQAIQGFEQEAIVRGNITGKLRNLKVKEMNIAFGKVSTISGSVNMKGLPDVDETFMEIKIDKALTNKTDLAYVFPDVVIPPNIAKLGNIRFSGNFTGFLYDFVTYGIFNTQLGTLRSDLNMKIGRGSKPTSYSGMFALTDFDAGRILETSSIGRVTLNSEIQGTGLSISSAYAKMKGEILMLQAAGYTYTGISLDGEISKRLFKGKAVVTDPNLEFDFAGTVNFSKSQPEFDFSARIAKANLKNLHLSKDSLVLSSNMEISFAGNSLEDINGQLNISDTRLHKADKTMLIDHIRLTASAFPDRSMLEVHSDIADVKIDGRYNFAGLPDAVNNYLAQLLPSYFEQKANPGTGQNFTFDVNLKNSSLLSELFMPGVTVTNGIVKGAFNSNAPHLSLNGSVQELNLNEQIFRNVTFSAVNQVSSHNLDIDVKIKSLHVADTIVVNDIVAAVDLTPDHVSSFIKTGDTSQQFHASLNNEISFLPDKKIEVQFLKSLLKYKQFSLVPDSEGRIFIEDKKLRFDRFILRKDDQSIAVNGTISDQNEDYVILTFGRLQLDFINHFAMPAGAPLNGLVDGDLIISKLFTQPIFASSLFIKDFSVGNDTLGNFIASTDYNISSDLMQLNLKSAGGLFRDLVVTGNINMKGEEKAINLNVSMQPTDIRWVEPAVSEFVSRISGQASCRLKITGTIDQPVVSGKLNIENAFFTVNYLRTSYSFSNTFLLDNDVIRFNSFTIKDTTDHTAQVSGEVYHKNFSNFYLKVKVNKMDNLVCLNTGPGDNTLFYGRGIASGSASFTGDLNDVDIKMDAVTEKNTMIFIPLDNSDDISQSSYVKFVGPNTSKTKYKADFSGFTLEFNLELTREAEIQLIFDSQVGDIIKGTGYANLKLEVDRAGDFKMYGDYIIEQGSYLFTALNVVNKPFKIKKGSRLTWDGDPMQARIDVEAVYEVTAAPYNLVDGKVIKEEADKYRQAIPVECLLYLSGLMLAPDFRFGIRFPEQRNISSADATMLNNVIKQLESTPEEINRQVFSLLIFKSFLPSNPGNAPIGSGIATSAGELLSNQLSIWLSQAVPGLQVGLNINNADTMGNKQAVIIHGSYNFLNDRLVIDGYIDANNNQSNNVSIQYVLTKDGRLRIKVYNKFVAANPSILIQQTNTQGIGLFYRKEYERIFRKKKKKVPASTPTISDSQKVSGN